MSEKKALYCRVSTENQDLERQKNKLKAWADSNNYEYDLYEEKVSSIKERKEFERIMSNLEKYDKIAVTKIDRFARSIRDFINRIERLKDNNTEFEAIDQPINTDDQIYGDFMLKQLVLFAELERKMIRRRLEDGFKEAKAQGKVGRPQKISGTALEKTVNWYNKGISYRDIELRLKEDFDIDVSRSAIYRALKRENAISDND